MGPEVVINIADIEQKIQMWSINQRIFIEYQLCVWNYLICCGRSELQGNLKEVII